MSPKKYMIIDLCVLIVIGCITEVIFMRAVQITMALQIVSLQLLIVLIAIFRWNGYGVLVATPIGITTYIMYGVVHGEWEIANLVIYSIGNLGAALSILTFKIVSKKNIKKGFEFVLLYCIIGYIGQVFLRTLLAFAFGSDFIVSLKNFFLFGNLLAFIISCILLVLVNKMDGVLVEPIEYLKEQLKEKKDAFVGRKQPYIDVIENVEKDKFDKEVDNNEQ